jgi:thiamine-monophosphate kinase
VPGLNDIGEFGLIDRIRTRQREYDDDVIVGIGDDCAVLKRGNILEVLTTDCLVEGTHYQPGWLSMEDVGWKSMAVNVSDVAAMGAISRHAVITLFIPDRVTSEDIDHLYEGLEACAGEAGVGLVGGDIVRIAGPFAVSITLSGTCELDDLVLRSGAREGDVIVVTGSLGEAAAGMEYIRSGRAPDRPAAVQSVARFRRPVARHKESRVLVEKLQPTSMIDISDGLIADLWHILEMSKVGVSLSGEAIPVGRGVLDLAGGDRATALALAMRGGEDYELLFTVSEKHADGLGEVAAEIGLDLTAIGRIASKKEGFVLAEGGVEAEVERGGFDHFRSPPAESKEV